MFLKYIYQNNLKSYKIFKNYIKRKFTFSSWLLLFFQELPNAKSFVITQIGRCIDPAQRNFLLKT